MTILPRKGLLAIAVVVDVALQTDGRPISAKTLATRHGLPPRHLELVLQSLVRGGILKGIRGPHGGYELVRERRGVTANDILRAAGNVHEAGEEPNSELVAKVVLPVLSVAEKEFVQALSRISLDDIVQHAAPAEYTPSKDAELMIGVCEARAVARQPTDHRKLALFINSWNCIVRRQRDNVIALTVEERVSADLQRSDSQLRQCREGRIEV
jgi:Rrf2 family protein